MISRGVKVTIAGSIINFFIGTFYSWSVFAEGLIQEFNWSKTEASFPYMVEVFVFAVMMFFAGRMQDKIGARRGATFSGLLIGAAFFLCALFPTPLAITISFGIIFGAGAAFGYAAVTPAAMKWFPPEKRGLITGFVVMSLGAGSLFWPPLLNTMIGSFGVVKTFFIWGIFLLVGILGMSRLVAEPPGKSPSGAGIPFKMDWKKIFSQPIFLQLWVMMGLSAGTGLMVVGHLVQISKINCQLEVGFILVSFFALFNTLGRFSGGLIIDRTGYFRAMFSTFLLIFASMLFLLFSQGLWGLLVGTILLAFSYGSLFTSFPSAVADLFGLDNFGAYYGLLFTSLSIGGSLGPLLAGYLADLTGNYNFTFVLGMAASLTALLLSLKLRRERASIPS